MIEKVQSFKVGEQFFNSFREAQQHELAGGIKSHAPDLDESIVHSLSQQMVAHKEIFIDALTMTPRSRAKARKVNGATRKRKAKPTLIEHSETSA